MSPQCSESGNPDGKRDAAAAYMYSPPLLVLDRMEELNVNVELLLVETVWCQKESLSSMHLLCRSMVSFGLGAVHK